MKKLRLLPVAVITVLLASFVMAGSGDKRGKLQDRWEMEDAILSRLNLTLEQTETIRILREAYRKESTPLRTEKYERQAELRLLWMQMNPDPDKIKAKQQQIHNLIWQLLEKSRDYQLAFRDILTPEQLAKFLELGGVRHHDHRRSR